MPPHGKKSATRMIRPFRRFPTHTPPRRSERRGKSPAATVVKKKAGSDDPAFFLTCATFPAGAASLHGGSRAVEHAHACYKHTLAMSAGVASGGISGFGEGRQLEEQNPPFGVCG